MLYYIHRFGIDDLFHRITNSLRQRFPFQTGTHPHQLLVNMSDDEDTTEMTLVNATHSKTRKKLHHHHIKDVSEGEKLISGSTLSEHSRR